MGKRFIIRKNQIIEIPTGIEGVPVETYFKNINLPKSIKGALVYELPQGRYIARQKNFEEE